jgi:uncharacterized protein YhjY with autotransporter beta-barrel domain
MPRIRRARDLLKTLVASSIFLGAGLFPLAAQQITLTPTANNLYNTGYNGTVLDTAHQADTHYELIGYGTGTAYQASPLAGGWAANPGNSQWITISPTTSTGPSIGYDYRLYLTGIPAGQVVTLNGRVAADDNVMVSGSGSSLYFSNYSPGVVSGHYNSFTTLPTLTFVSGTTNYFDFVVTNSGGGPTGLNLQLSGFYTPLLSTAGLDIHLTVPNLDPNQQSVLTYINGVNAVGVNNSCFSDLTTALLGLDANGLAAAMDELSPEKFAVFSTIAFNNATFQAQDLDDYLAHRRTPAGTFASNPGGIDSSGLTVSDPTIDPGLSAIYSQMLAWNPAPPPAGVASDVTSPLLVGNPSALAPVSPVNVFVRGNVTLGQEYAEQDLEHRDSTTGSFGIGADYQVDPNLLVGVIFDYSHTDTDLDGAGSSATIDSYSPGVYASYARDGWYANALATYTRNAYTEQRRIAIGAFSQNPSGTPSGDQEMANLDFGYDFHEKGWTYGPTAAIQYDHLGVDGFTESGGCSANLNVDRETAESLRSRLGGHVLYSASSGGLLFTPFIDASWQHEFLDGARAITSSFSDIGLGQFTVETPAAGRESLLVSAGLNIDFNRTLAFFASYTAQLDPDDYFGQSILAGFKIAF